MKNVLIMGTAERDFHNFKEGGFPDLKDVLRGFE